MDLLCVACIEQEGDLTDPLPACVVYEGRSLCRPHYEDLSERLAEAMVGGSES